MRRVLGLLSLLALAASPARGQQALVGMYPAGVGIDSGQRATIPLVVDLNALGGTMLGSYQLQVSWDPAVLRYIGTSAGGFGSPTVNDASAASGSITLAGVQPGGVAGLFTVAGLTFEMLVTTGSSPVTVGTPELTAAGTFAAIPVIATPGNVCNGGTNFGDVNNDGTILSNDALLVVTAAVGLPITPYTLANGDVDNDGDADTRDALVILTAAVGLPTSGFRVGQPNPASSCGGSPAATIVLNPGAVSAAAGDVFPITVQVFDGAGLPTAASGLVWSSDAGGVATVDSLGNVTAVGNGSAAISAIAIGVPSQSVSVTVQARHTWYVDAVGAAQKSVQLGSAAFPYADVQPGLNAAAAGDTVLVLYAPAGYGPATITRPVTMLGDSGTYGMPQLRNSVGPALTSNAPGTVTLRRLALSESNAGLDARGDSLIIESVAAASLRGIAFRIHGMQSASLTGITANSAVLAGVLADSTGTVRINGAVVRVIAQRNDSAAGIAILAGDSAIVTNLDVLGVENGQGAVFSRLSYGRIDGFDMRAAGGVNADSVGAMILAYGRVHDAGGAERPISIHADLASLDSVVVDGAERGIELSPMAPDTVTNPLAAASITRTAIRNVRGAGGIIVERFGQLAVSGLEITNVQLDHGLEVRRVPAVQIDSATITGIGEGLAVLVDAVAGSQLAVHGATLRAHQGGLSVDAMPVVSLSGITVDSSAVPPQFCFGCSAGWAIRVVHADSVRLDSLNVHDNIGGGILVDSARVVVGRGSSVDRNFGFGGSGGECGELGCQTEGKTLRPGLTHGQYNSNFVPGVVLNGVRDTRLARWSVQDNANGGVLFSAWDLQTTPSATVDTSVFRGNRTLLDFTGNAIATDGVATIRGGRFVAFETGVSGSYLGGLTISGAVFDSSGSYYRMPVQTYYTRAVRIEDDTLTGGTGWGIQIQNAARADVLRNLVRGRLQADVNSQEAAIELAAVDTGLVSGNRLELNAVRGIIVRNGFGPMLIDGNVVADDSGFAAVQLHQPTVVTNNLFARNFNGVYITDAGGPSSITNNNFIGNVFTAVRNESGQVVDATSNWWNDTRGPRCAGAAGGCDTLSTGDIAYGSTFAVDFSGWLLGPASGAPIAAPRFLGSRRTTR